MNTLRVITVLLCLVAGLRILDKLVYAADDIETVRPAVAFEPELADSMRELEVLTHKLGLAFDATNFKLTQFYHRESFYKSLEIMKTFPDYEGDPVAKLMSSTLLDSYYNIKDGIDHIPTDFKVLSVEYDTLINRCNACHAATNRASLKIKRNHENPYLIDFAISDVSGNE